MLPNFLNPPLERLGADGRLEPAASGAPWRRPRVLLARELCSFELFAPAGVSGANLAAAARLHARTAGPYARSASLVWRKAGRCVIWWWDLDRVGPALEAHAGGARLPAIPETLMQPSGEGWRVVRLAHGYEAQLWADGALIASRWRREPFEPESWRAFVRAAPPGAPPPPSTPPPAHPLPLSGRNLWRLAVAELSPAGLMQPAAWAGALLLVAVSCFALGQGLRLRSLADADERRAEALGMASPGLRGPVENQAQQRLAAYRRLASRPNGLAAVARALQLANAQGLHPTGFDLEGDRLTVDVPYAELDRVEGLALQLQRSGFSSVTPMADARDKLVQLQMNFRGAAPVNPAG